MVNYGEFTSIGIHPINSDGIECFNKYAIVRKEDFRLR